MGTRREVTELLHEAGLRPRKRLGQNFLVDEVALRRIIEAADLGPEDVVLEIGAGLGTLTRLLAEQARYVLAVEIDANLIQVLQDALADLQNVKVVQGDILTLPLDGLWQDVPLPPSGTYKVVANLPYYITSAILRRLLEADRKPACLIVTVQEEVARRIVAGPGEMSLLAISVQLYGHPRIVARIPAGAFYPVPKVDSAVIRVDLGDRLTVDVGDVAWFFSVVRAGFSARRKQLHNTLSHGLALPGVAVSAALLRAGVAPSRRAQTLTLDEWARLCQELRAETGLV